MSDQDFFFDEDETQERRPASKAAPKSAPGKAAASRAKSAPVPAAGGIELTWTITALIGIVALLLGVIVGYAIPKGAEIATPTTDLTQTQGNAPQLTPEQMSSGQLPAGHPNIGAAAGSGAASGTAPSTTATGN